MKKYKYHSPKARSVAKAKKDFTGRPIISIWLEVKKWYGWVKCGWAWGIESLKQYFIQFPNIEGIVWHHPDGRMVKLKLRDFGIKRVNNG